MFPVRTPDLLAPPAPAGPALAWEDAACPLCGRDDAQPVAEAADPSPLSGPGLRFAVVRCRHCSLAYTNPRPSPAAIGRFYPPDYAPHESGSVGRGRVGWRLAWRFLGYPAPERRGMLPGPPGRVLDFGCGGGSYLSRLASLGWRVTGLDASPAAVRRVREELGFEVFAGSLPHPALAPGSFDAVTMWQSLEHVHRPSEVLREAFRLLVPGGHLVVAVPNFDSPMRRWLGEHWYGYDLPRHLTHFTRATLAAALRAAGFRVGEVRGLVRVSWTRAGARRAVEAGAGGPLARLVRWRAAARVVSWGCYASGGAESLVAVARRPE